MAKLFLDEVVKQQAEERERVKAPQKEPETKPEVKPEAKPEVTPAENQPEPKVEEGIKEPEPKPEEIKKPVPDDEEYDDRGAKAFIVGVIVIAVMITVVLAAIGWQKGWWGNNSSEGTATVSENDPKGTVNVTVKSTDLAQEVSRAQARGAQPVLMPDNENYVYIEGITEKMANDIDSMLRYYESVKDIDPAEIEGTDTEHLYTVTLPRLAESWDPQFDLIEAVLSSDTEATYNDTLIRDILAVEENRQYFYFELDEASGVYQASIMYYYLAGVWAEIAEETAGE